MKVLCLHGARQTAEMFEHQLNKLSVELAGVAELHFLDAPHVLPSAEGDAEATRLWCVPTHGSETEKHYAAGDAAVQSHLLSFGPYDAVLGFSQGALMAARYVMLRATRGGDAYGPELRGIIIAASPDPRLAFSELTALYHATWGSRESVGTKECKFFDALPSLHIIGRKDTIVSPDESVSFASACGPSAECIMHDHAHSVPQLQNVVRAIGTFLARLPKPCAAHVPLPDTSDTAGDHYGDEELAASREEELELIESMYGEDCVERGPAGCAEVSLPLLPDDMDCDSAAEAAARPRLRLRFTLSRRYPCELPALGVIGGPANHHVAFERWRAALLERTAAYLRENHCAGDAVLLSALMFASEQSTADVSFIREAFLADVPHAGDDAAAAGEDTADPDASRWAEDEAEAEDQDKGEARRAARIAEAERVASRLLAAPLLDGLDADDAAAHRGGSVVLTIGLIGKPSAGKSTFFNAVTDPVSESAAARVAAFPFTTIEPNIAGGFAPLFCPCAAAAAAATAHSCDAAFGHVALRGSGQRRRRHPVLVKDVAGLVRGAYRGRGKGNQFLNDLCDAHVLVHVVDGAGATDADGAACAPGSGSTRDDITWVRAEVHSWIYDNLRARWASICRRPVKLREMFTGYRSAPSFVDALLLRLGVGDVSCVRAWGPAELHALVALYVRARFPIVIALNKADVYPAAPQMAAELRRLYPDETFVPLSAKMECHLLRLRQRGIVRYAAGDAGFAVVAGGGPAGAADAAAIAELRRFFAGPSDAAVGEKGEKGEGDVVNGFMGTTTGVQEVLAEAMERCACVAVFPVAALATPPPSLRECFTFKLGTSAGEVFEAMVHAGLSNGKLVRFEAVCAEKFRGGEPHIHILKRDSLLPGRHVLVRVLSNKRQIIASTPNK